MFSVIIPSYNRYERLCQALDSVLAQTLAASQIIVINDGSSDPRYHELKRHYPSVQIHHHGNNQGVSASRNLGIMQAQQGWLAFLDDDDQWLPQKLQKQADILTAQPEYLICHTDEIWIRDGKRVNPMLKHQKKGGWVLRDNLELCRISPSSVVIHQELLAKVGHFDINLPACEDYELWLRITARFPVLYLDEKLVVKQGGHADQLSKKYWGMDRFRIQSLIRLLHTTDLNSVDKQAVTDVLQQKIAIYLQGAKKREKIDDILYYQDLQVQYGS